MKICYLGNKRAPWCTEVHVAKSLEELGHEVVFLQESETSNEQILEATRNADVFLLTHTWGWQTIDLETLKKLPCPSVYYHLDLVKGIPDRESRVDDSPWYRCSFVFMPDGDPISVKWFRDKGVNYHYSPPAVYGGGCYLADPVEELKQDVIFVGARYERYHQSWIYRKTLIEKLEQQYGSRFTVYEHSTQMREEKLNSLYASCKVAVGDSFCPGFDRKYYVSDRLFEPAGRYCAQVFPRIYGIWDYFDENKEILTYDWHNWADLFNKIDWLIDHNEERIAMRNAAAERVKREHTYKTRLKNALDVVLRDAKNIYE